MFFKLDGGSRKKKKKPAGVVWYVYAGWGNFLCKLSRRFGHHRFSQSDCFIVTSCWVWGTYTHTHLSLRGCFWSRPRRRFPPLRKNNHYHRYLPFKRARAISQRALAQLTGRAWGEFVWPIADAVSILQATVALPMIAADRYSSTCQSCACNLPRPPAARPQSAA